MSGHSKWKNIQHRKGAQDAARGKVFTKLIKEITVAVKSGGGPDPDSNPRLRLALQNARGQNMNKDTIERAIKKASGEGSEEYFEITFEGYGPDGVAIFVEVATNNNQRSVSNVRSYFTKAGGSLGVNGCLQFIFERKGFFEIPAAGLNEDDFTLEMIDAGASDVDFDEEEVEVLCAMEDFGSIQKKLAEMNIEPKESGLRRDPTTTKEVTKEVFERVMRLIDTLEDDDDVLKVYHNMEFDESFLEE